MLGRLGRSVLAALGFWFMGSGVARAQDGRAATPSRQYDSGRGVDVTVVGGGEDVKDLVNTVREVVGRLGLQVRVQVVPQASPEPAESSAVQRLARVEINLLSPSVAQVIVYGRTGEVVLQQRFGRSVSPPVLREEVADAVRSAVEAQLLIDPETGKAIPAATNAPTRGHSVNSAPGPASPFSAAEPPVAEPPALAPVPTAVASVAPVPTPASEAPATPTAAWARSLALDLTAVAGVGGFAWGSAGVVSHVGGEATVAYRKWPNPSITVTGEYLIPFDAIREGVDAQVNVEAVRVVPAVQVFRWRYLAIDAGAGAGLDVMSVRTRSIAAPNYAPLNANLVDPVLRGEVTALVGLAPRTVLSLTLAYDLDVTAPHPRFALPGDATPVIAPWRARPLGLIGLTFAALGEARFVSGILR